MPFLKRTLLVVLVSLLPLLLLGVALSFGLNKTVGNPEKVKNILDRSGVYQSLIPSMLFETQETGEGEVPLTDPAIRNAATSAFSPQFVKQSAEKIIDSTFAWLEGKTDEPSFNIDLSGPKAAFLDAAATSVKERAASLPACTTASLPADFDVFNATCLPVGVTPQLAAERVRTELNGQGFLEENSLTAQDLKTGDLKQPVFSQMENLPEVYQQAQRMPIYLAILAFLVSAGIIFFSATRRRGLRKVGIVLAVVGLLMLVFSWLLPSQALTWIGSGSMPDQLRELIRGLLDETSKNYRLFGGLYALIGLAAIALTAFWTKSGKKESGEDGNGSSSEEKPMESRSATRPAPRKKVIKIQ